MKKLHLICNAHIDPIWQWEWEEGASTALSTFQSAANLLKEYNYTFNHNEVNLYKYTERFAPHLFQEIQELVKEGKWKIMGGWYLQPDCLMPTGEGLVRQIQEGRLYFEEKFHQMPKTAINFDPFGHSRGLVQILKKCGQENYLFMRPWANQLALEDHRFLWEGYDGSQVKVYRFTSYGSTLGKVNEKLDYDIDNRKDEEIAASLWGVGNHGGGPSRKDLEIIEEYKKSHPDIEIVHSDPDTFFKDLHPTYVFKGSLIPCMAGCYTSMVNLKQRYRKLENELLFTEKVCSIASLKGVMKYPDKIFREATEDMLNIQFHDILPGDMVVAGEENGMMFANHGLHLLNQARADALYGMIKGSKIAEEGTYPVFVLNPKTYEVEQYAEVDMSILPTDHYTDVDGKQSYLVVYDEEGNEVLSQNIKESSNIAIDWRKHAIFKGKLKPLSVTRFTLKTEVRDVPTYPVNEDVIIKGKEHSIRINSKTGLIESFVVKGKEYIKGETFIPYLYEDYEDPWGMNYTYVGWNPSPFKKQDKPDGPFEKLQSFEVFEDGDIYTACEAFFAHGLTRIRMAYKAYKNEPRIDVDVKVFPNEASKAIKLHIPYEAKEIIGDQVFGKEPLFLDGRECISHNFLAIKTGEDEYLEIIKPSHYASSYKDGVLALTLLRTATYCAHPIPGRKLLRDNIYIDKVDQGQRDFYFSIQVSSEKELERRADLFVEKPYALNIFPSVDTKDDNGFIIKTTNPNINMVTVKKGAQIDGYLLRMQNNSEEEADDELLVGSSTIKLHFHKYEVKTILYKDGKLKELEEMLI